MSFCTLYGFRPFRRTYLDRMAGTTELEPATSAVTEGRNLQKKAPRMASFGALRHDQEPLSNPYLTRDLCRTDFCPNKILPE